MESTVLRCAHCSFTTTPQKSCGKPCAHCGSTKFIKGEYIYDPATHTADIKYPPEPDPQPVKGDEEPDR